MIIPMSKKSRVTHFTVEPSEYGWTVRDGLSKLGLFVSQKHAVADAKVRQRSLRAQGAKSEVTVLGEDAGAARSRMQPFFKARMR
jgi:hypothetical protein